MEKIIEPELEFNSVKFVIKSKMINSLKFYLNIEKKNLVGMTKIYESRYFHEKEFKEKNIINEKFKFKMTKEHFFINLKIQFNIKRDDKIQKEYYDYFLFLEDLIKKDKKLTINFFENNIIKIYYNLKTNIEPKFDNFEKVANEIKKEEDPGGMLEMAKLSQEFLGAITPLRRIKTDFVDYLLQDKKYISEFFFFLSIIFFIFYPLQILTILFFIFFFTNWKYKLREKIVKKGMRYFEPNESKMVRMTKNLNMIKEIQIHVIMFSDKLLEIFYGQNRFYLYYIFRFSFLIGILLMILIIILWNTKVIILFSVLFLYLMRNIKEISSFFPESKKNNLLNNVVKKVGRQISSLNKSISFETDNIITKKFYYYENERWFIISGFIPTKLERPHFSDINGDYEINPENIKLEKGWKWTENWKILINEETDDKGWSYAKSFNRNFHNYNKKFDVIRRRAWYRKCCKKKTE